MWARWILAAALTVLAGGIPLTVAIAVSWHAAETEAFDSVYYAALLSGRDANAAVRKAHFRTDILVKQFGMTRSDAAAEVARAMIWRSGSLCGG